VAEPTGKPGSEELELELEQHRTELTVYAYRMLTGGRPTPRRSCAPDTPNTLPGPNDSRKTVVARPTANRAVFTIPTFPDGLPPQPCPLERSAAMSIRKAIPVPEGRDLFLDAEMRADVRALLLELTPRQRAASCSLTRSGVRPSRPGASSAFDRRP
jgi:hypothetical protein